MILERFGLLYRIKSVSVAITLQLSIVIVAYSQLSSYSTYCKICLQVDTIQKLVNSNKPFDTLRIHSILSNLNFQGEPNDFVLLNIAELLVQLGDEESAFRQLEKISPTYIVHCGEPDMYCLLDNISSTKSFRVLQRTSKWDTLINTLEIKAQKYRGTASGLTLFKDIFLADKYARELELMFWRTPIDMELIKIVKQIDSIHISILDSVISKTGFPCVAYASYYPSVIALHDYREGNYERYFPYLDSCATIGEYDWFHLELFLFWLDYPAMDSISYPYREIQFDSLDNIQQSSICQIERIIKYLSSSHFGKKITLEYHCDKVVNVKAAENRIHNLKEYMIHRGIDKERISVKIQLDDKLHISSNLCIVTGIYNESN